MPIQRRRTDGFSDDGLSYSVASDFDKQIGQALAAQEARLKDPRYIPGAQVERPDAPDILNRELIDPVLTAFGMPNSEDRAERHGRYNGPSSSVFKSGNDIISIDKNTNAAHKVYTGAVPEMTQRQKLEYSDLLHQRNALQTGIGARVNADKIKALDDRINGFFGAAPAAAAVPAVVAPADLLSTNNFIGTPGGTNLFQSAAAPGVLSTQGPAQAAAVMDAPMAARDRKAGQAYNTPKGLLKWTGTGWAQP